MLNQNNERELVYVVKIDEICSIPNYDRVEYARVGGWWVIVKKDEFKVGDLAVYFEIDSKVPATEPFMFLASRHFKVKTLKMCKVISQGLLIHPNQFNFKRELIEGEFLTKELGITYADAEDNQRKAPSADKYKKMVQRRPKLFRNPIVRWFMRREWGRRLMFFFFGKKKDKRGGWPAWVKKTDEERVQNMPWLFNPEANYGKWVVTEKVDGTSTTFTMKGYGKKREFYVCSHNAVFDTPEKAEKCFYDSNVYLEMAEKYHIKDVMDKIMSQYGNLDFLTIQGETYGGTIQKRNYGLNEHKLAIFNIIYGWSNGDTERLNPIQMENLCQFYDLPCVPIVDECFTLPATCEEMLDYAASAPSKIDGGMREGVVLRSMDGVMSFKAVSNEFLMKYHNG